MAIKDRNGGVSWNEWEEPLKNKESQAIENAKAELSRQIAFYKFQQYEFDRQWKRLRSYANENGIEIIGDIPIYVAFDSADTWSRRRCSVLMTLLNRSMLRDVRRMDFRRQDSCGGIRSTIGNIIKNRVRLVDSQDRTLFPAV